MSIPERFSPSIAAPYTQNPAALAWARNRAALTTRPTFTRSSAPADAFETAVSYTHLRAHETRHDLVCRLLLRPTPLYSSAASDVYNRQPWPGRGIGQR